MRFLFFILLLALCLPDFGQMHTVSVIPAPLSLIVNTGKFTINSATEIDIDSKDSSIKKITTLMADRFYTASGYRLKVDHLSKRNNTRSNTMVLDLVNDTSLGAEGYMLFVNTTSVKLYANKPAGLFYAVQTLFQLMPKEIESITAIKNIQWSIPALRITDKPRFGWRGLMLDVSRHFFTIDQVKDFIDNMVRYKYNLLHLHLADDQGWRLQIPALPKLTQTGAWRVRREGKWGNTPAPDSAEPRTYGGFYSANDIHELVAYASERFVNILPEIDVPGHSSAAIASYPDLSCTPGSYHVNAGDKIMQWHGGGKFSALYDNNLCPAKESVYAFLDTVFTTVAALFPFEYIHIGGDEAAKNIWETTDTIKALMARDSLETMNDVQAYFIKRVQKIIQSKGKKMIGWDEILEGGLDTAAGVMSWRGMKAGIAASSKGHNVVMSPSEFVYMDLMQGDKVTEPNVYATVRLGKTYQFDPLPAGTNPQFVMGGQGNMWTEQIPGMRALQYMLWPRGLALAECLWTSKENKNYNRFITHVEHEFKRMDVRRVKYARTMYEPVITAWYDSTVLHVKIETEISGLTTYYSFDETNPDEFYPAYKTTLTIPKDMATLKLVTYKNGVPAGRQINMPVAELEKRAGKK